MSAWLCFEINLFLHYCFLISLWDREIMIVPSWRFINKSHVTSVIIAKPDPQKCARNQVFLLNNFLNKFYQLSQRLVSKGSNFHQSLLFLSNFYPLRKDRITPFFVPLDLNESGITKLVFFPSLSKSFPLKT